MLPIHKVNLESAQYIRHPDNSYPAVELTIDGKKAYLIELDRRSIEAGFAEIIDISGYTNWSSILPEIKVSQEDAKKYSLPERLTGVTTDPRIVEIAATFWEDINRLHGFEEGRVVYP